MTENRTNSTSSGVNATVHFTNEVNQEQGSLPHNDDEIRNGFGCYIIDSRVGPEDENQSSELVESVIFKSLFNPKHSYNLNDF